MRSCCPRAARRTDRRQIRPSERGEGDPLLATGLPVLSATVDEESVRSARRGALIASSSIMRSTSFLLSFLLAACTSTAEDTSTLPEHVDPMPCRATIDDSCNSAGCNRTLDAAEHDPRLCSPGFPAVLFDCGDFQVVSKSETDTVKSYYYKYGQLAAIVGHVVGAGFSGCIAGPQSFEAPRCNNARAVPLPACSATP